MQKINLKSDVDINKVLRDLAKNPYFKEFPISEDNLNECLLFLSEKENCINCAGLDKCKNHQPGYMLKMNGDKFLLVRCSKKVAEDLKNSQSELIHTLYMPKSIKEANFSDFTLNTPARAKAMKLANDFVNGYGKEKFIKGLFLTGGFGCGKTYLLGATAAELAKKNIKSLLIYFPDLIRELKNSLGSERFEEIVNNLKEIDVLMLDDFGSETMTPWLRDEILGPILNYRLAEGKALFISSNLTAEQIINHLMLSNDSIEKTKATRIVSRILGLTEFFNLGKEQYKK